MKNKIVDIFVRNTIASNVSALRHGAEISQTKFAQMIEVNRPYYNRIELGRKNISLDMVVKIADGLDVPITSLLNGLGNDSPSTIAKVVSHSK